MQTVAWLAGRGVARSCGLDWEVPEVLYAALQTGRIRRTQFEARIRCELAAAEAASTVDPMPRESLLDTLERRTACGWRHEFLTTNWNTLLDRALARRSARVWHLNGSLQGAGRLDTGIDTRDADYGAKGLEHLLKAQVCVLAGLSFASRLDRALLERLGGAACVACIVVNEEVQDAARRAAAGQVTLRTCYAGSGEVRGLGARRRAAAARLRRAYMNIQAALRCSRSRRSPRATMPARQ